MALAHQEITKISGDLAREFPHPTVEFVSVVATEGDRVEVMVRVNGCHAQPCSLMFNLPRSDKASFERELRTLLERELRNHMRRQ